MPKDNTLSLRMAVATALRERGTRLFERPGEFLGYVLDLSDPDADTGRALLHNCDDDLMDIFLQAAGTRAPQAIEDAANRAALLLKDERMIQENIARQVACEIAFALSNHLRVACPEAVRLVAVGTVDPAQGKSSHAQASSWYEAQRARSEVRSTHNVGEPKAESAKNSYKGQAVRTNSGNTVSPGSKSPTAQAAATSTTSALDPTTLSTDRAERQKQIEAAGIGMRWFDWLKWICWGTAALRLSAAFGYFAILREVNIASVFLHYLTGGIVMIALCIAYLVSWNRLRKFKENGPKTFLTTLGINIIYPLIEMLWMLILTEGMLPFNLGSNEVQASAITSLLFTAINAFVWECTYKYFNKRKQFFNL